MYQNYPLALRMNCIFRPMQASRLTYKLCSAMHPSLGLVTVSLAEGFMIVPCAYARVMML